MAITLNLFREGAVGFIDWLGLAILRHAPASQLPGKQQSEEQTNDDSAQSFQRVRERMLMDG